MIGLLYLTVKQSKITTNKVFEDWTNRVSKLCTNVEKGCFALALSCARWIFAIGFLFFLILVVTFTLRQRVDLIDGARIAGAFLFSLVLSLGSLAFSLIQIPKFINSVIKTTLDKQSMRVGLNTALLGSSGIAFLAVGTAFCGFCGTFLLMTIDRSDPLGNGVFAYGNQCKTTGNGAFCGQTLSLPATCGFCMGLSVVALMSRSMTGVLAKAAEIGDELVDKLESSTLDQLFNPAQCLDFVGNLAAEAVGTAADCAESLALPVLAAAFLAQGDSARMAVPFWVAGFGLFSAIIGKLVVSSRDGGTTFAARHRSLTGGLRVGLYTTVLLTLALSAVTIGILYPLSFPYYLGDRNQDLTALLGSSAEGWKLFAVCCIGLVTGLAAWESTAFFTSHRCGPTRSVAASGASGVATHLIQGLGVGLLSCLPTALLLTVDVIACHAIAGQYGVALSAVATAAPLAFALTADALSPVAYAAGSMVCGSDAPQTLKDLLAPLDMAAMGGLAEARGWSVLCGAKVALAVLAAYRAEAGLGFNADAFRWADGKSVAAGLPLLTVGGAGPGPAAGLARASPGRGGVEGDVIGDGLVFGAAAVGAFMPLLCAGVAVLAIGKTTRTVVDDARSRIDVSRRGGGAYDAGAAARDVAGPAALGSLLPAWWALFVPALVGFLLGPRALAGLVAGGILGGAGLAAVCVNAGSSWAKSEASIAYEGSLGGADSEAHRASWAGTRLGGALREVAGPMALSVMKTMAMVALLIAPLIFADKDIGTTTADGLRPRPPANEAMLWYAPPAGGPGVVGAGEWWRDSFISAPHFRACLLRKAAVGGESALACFDWNKAYWAGFPAFLLAAVSVAVYAAHWAHVPPPLELRSAAPGKAAPSYPVSPVAQYVEISRPYDEVIAVQRTQLVPIQLPPGQLPPPQQVGVPMQFQTQQQPMQLQQLLPQQFQPLQQQQLLPQQFQPQVQPYPQFQQQGQPAAFVPQLQA